MPLIQPALTTNASAESSITTPSLAVISIFVLLLAIVLTIRTLEFRTVSIQSYFHITSEEKQNPLQLLLPVSIGTGQYRWTTTGLIVQDAFENIFGTKLSFLILHIIMMSAIFAASWCALKSPTLSLTSSFILGLASVFTYHYVNSSIGILLLYTTYIAVNLASFYSFLKRGTIKALCVFIVSLLMTVLCWEMWLDYAIFLLLSNIFISKLSKDKKMKIRGRTILFISAVTMLLYISVRCHYSSEHFRPGSEAELITKYFALGPSGLILFTEDLISNFFTYIYLTFNHFLPPPLIASNSLTYFSRNALVAAQNGYDPQNQDFTFFHYIFLWYFYAGVYATIFVYLFVKISKKALKTRNERNSITACLMLMVLCGFSSHMLIKFRPYLSVPFLSYKCITSIIGVSVLISYSLAQIIEKKPPRKQIFLIGYVCIFVILTALLRPTTLSVLGSVGNWTHLGSMPSALSGK